MRFRSWRTASNEYRVINTEREIPTGYTREELSGKVLDLATGERNEAIPFQKVKHTLPEQIGDNADVVAVIEAIPQVDTLVAVLLIIRGERGQHSQFDPGCIPVFLNRADDLHGAPRFAVLIICLDHLSKGALSEEFDDGVCHGQD